MINQATFYKLDFKFHHQKNVLLEFQPPPTCVCFAHRGPCFFFSSRGTRWRGGGRRRSGRGGRPRRLPSTWRRRQRWRARYTTRPPGEVRETSLSCSLRGGILFLFFFPFVLTFFLPAFHQQDQSGPDHTQPVGVGQRRAQRQRHVAGESQVLEGFAEK